MAKSSKTAKSDRQKVIDDIRRKQKSAEKRQGMVIVGVCVAIAVGLIVAAAWKPVQGWFQTERNDDKPLTEIGASADVCGKITTRKANGSQDHVPTGQEVEYEHAPPAFGPHWNEANVAPAPIDQRFYTGDGRPDLESLVHNLEHGYTILWYDEEIADDAARLGEIRAIAKQLDQSDTNGRYKFKAVPWTSEDGEPFPDGQHVAITHWTQDQTGIWQYCEAPSGKALWDFMVKYPYTDSPEPNVF